MASQLLDFEQSIARELEAELLTGKDLNLEKARLLALQGKNTEAAAEMARQVGGTAELSRMNVLQQEALADAVGLSRDELIASVQQREILERIGDRSLEQLYAEHGTREAIAAITGEELLRSMEQESATAKFEAAVIKLQEAFGNMMAGPFGNFIDGLANAMNHAGVLKLLLYGMTAISFGKLLMSLASMGATLATTAVGAMATASALSLGIAAIAIIGGIAAMAMAFSSASSSTQAAARSSRNVGDASMMGSTLTPMQEGTMIQAKPDDEIHIGRKTPGNNNSKTEEKFDKLIALFEKGNKNTEAIAKKNNNVVVNAIPGVAYEQQQVNSQNDFSVSLS